ncbi:LOW QUALITY PROTEIN: hypothetical protein HID58_022273 [Brassica napus]|uniref:Replication protein A 70 kDa DNA-binding subunit B/D first OB fold domain-containing protein n=1 Tax=Brassica napus TaxID=3708 RepID=A0ABQ8D119_BRANA|nr:LOW QUALITY PROTEIN: hypothetical protein HID58_022273 [Brassica napus]
MMNRLSEVVYDEKLTCWRFRVKILRIYIFYSYIIGNEPYWAYVLADEAGTKMEMTIYDRPREAREKICGNLLIGHAYSGFKAEKSPFRLTTTSDTQVYIIDPMNNQLYFDFKNIHEIPHIRNMDINYPIDVSNISKNTYLVDTMGVVFNTEAHFDDHKRPKMPEVEEFRQSLLRSDLMFRNMGYKAFVNLVVLIVLYLRICLKLTSLKFLLV